MNKVIYVTPECWWSSDDGKLEFERMSDSEKLKEARNNDKMVIYSLEDFQKVFNGEEFDEGISDLGYIFFVHEDE